MFNFLQKHGLTVAISIAAFISIVSVVTHNNIAMTYKEATEIVSKDTELLKIKDPEKQNESMRMAAREIHKESKINGIGTLVGFGDFLILLTALVALVLPVYLLKDQPKKLMISGGVVVGALVLFFITYGLSSVEIQNVKESFSAGDAKLTGAIVMITMIGFAVAVLAVVGSEVNNFIKER